VFLRRVCVSGDLQRGVRRRNRYRGPPFGGAGRGQRSCASALPGWARGGKDRQPL